MITPGCRNSGSHPVTESAELLPAYADLQPEALAADVDWYATEFDRIAEQTLGGGRPF